MRRIFLSSWPLFFSGVWIGIALNHLIQGDQGVGFPLFNICLGLSVGVVGLIVRHKARSS